MTRLIFILPDGERRALDLAPGDSVMTTARRHGVPGIEAECGGALSCGTCHVYVDAGQAGTLPGPSDQEAEILAVVAAERRTDSRMACQIKPSADVAELVIRIPATQY